MERDEEWWEGFNECVRKCESIGYTPGKNGTKQLEESLYLLNGICNLLTEAIINIQTEQTFRGELVMAWPMIPKEVRRAADLIESTEVRFNFDK